MQHHVQVCRPGGKKQEWSNTKRVEQTSMKNETILMAKHIRNEHHLSQNTYTLRKYLKYSRYGGSGLGRKRTTMVTQKPYIIIIPYPQVFKPTPGQF
jgi:competence transcription factor ComK